MARTKCLGDIGLGPRIEQFMKESQLGLSELSARTGISASYLSRIVRGEVANPTINFVVRIADGLGVSVSDLLAPRSSPFRFRSTFAVVPVGQSDMKATASRDETLGDIIKGADEIIAMAEALLQQEGKDG